jgi:hypothetical protein
MKKRHAFVSVRAKTTLCGIDIDRANLFLKLVENWKPGSEHNCLRCERTVSKRPAPEPKRPKSGAPRTNTSPARKRHAIDTLDATKTLCGIAVDRSMQPELVKNWNSSADGYCLRCDRTVSKRPAPEPKRPKSGAPRTNTPPARKRHAIDTLETTKTLCGIAVDRSTHILKLAKNWIFGAQNNCPQCDRIVPRWRQRQRKDRELRRRRLKQQTEYEYDRELEQHARDLDKLERTTGSGKGPYDLGRVPRSGVRVVSAGAFESNPHRH